MRKTFENSNLGLLLRKRLQEAGAVLLFAIGLYFLLALISYHPDDPSWANTHSESNIRNLGGLAGAWLSHSLYFLFGKVSFVLPLMVIGISLQVFRAPQRLSDRAFDASRRASVFSAGYLRSGRNTLCAGNSRRRPPVGAWGN